MIFIEYFFNSNNMDTIQNPLYYQYFIIYFTIFLFSEKEVSLKNGDFASFTL